jgi:hypothetical protein
MACMQRAYACLPQITNDDPNTENEFKILNDVAAGFVQDIFNSREVRQCLG